ncbi:SPOR domain-containing protein [Marinobacter sp. DY40_1A1]|uniref:SPOR domain-containing protein n=1 Tax=Marinobacter sp. DY40_1A1 TaxID=2583229 RepID=UPI001905756E|nr:SPOR domain-containing protein [Marinobacter sp. DY40_1A1]MBK1886014.1 SPOR domain-containing protein [Marinobacter sp. DY40_1A1]
MDGLKQRIIGALVLISLAVIFVPMVFDEPHSKRTSTSINIPEEPPFPEVETPVSDLAAPPAYQQDSVESASSGNQGFRILEDDASAAQPVPDAREKPTADVAKPAPAEPSQPKPVASSATTRQTAPDPKAPETSAEQESSEYTRSLEGAWVVQLGSFGDSDNARRLRDNVRKAGYSSHLQEVVRGDTTLTRVFSGPFAEKSKAEEAKRALDEAFKLNSLVTSGDK